MINRIIRGAVAAGVIAAVAYLSTKDDQVLCNTADLYFAVTGSDHDETGFSLFIRLRNKSNRSLRVRCVRPSVLGYSVPVDFDEVLKPHSMQNGDFWINIEFLNRYGIRSADEFSFWLEVTDADTAETVILAKHILYPTGKAEYQLSRPAKKHTATEFVCADNSEMSFSILGWRLTDTQRFVIDALAENRSPRILYTEWKDVLVNGRTPKMPVVCEREADPGILDAFEIRLFPSFFSENDLNMCAGEEGLKTLSFTLSAYTDKEKTNLIFERPVVWEVPLQSDELEP